MINGADTDQTEFTLLSTDALQTIMDDCRVVRWGGFGGKPAYRIPVNKFIWREL